MKILFAGAGAMGARFGALLHRNGNDIVFADGWQAHRDAINEHGLKMIIDGVDEGFVHIPAVSPNQVEGTFDLVFVFTKAMHLDSMMQDIQHVITDTTRVICLLNGLGNAEVIERYVPKENIFLGVTVWTSGLGGPGIVDAVGTGAIELQQVHQIPSSFNERLLETLNQAGLNVIYSDDVKQSIWNKVALNSVLNTYCTLIDCNVAEYGHYENNRILTELVVDEVIAVANAEGIVLDKDALVSKIEAVYDPQKAGNHYPSLYQDMAAGRKTEIDYLNGAIARLGTKHGIATPVCLAITHMIHAKESVKKTHR